MLKHVSRAGELTLECLYFLYLLLQLGFYFLFFYPVLFCGAVLQLLYARAVDIIPFLRVSIKDKAVLVTGCDTGFGFKIAELLDRHGCIVFANCLTKEGATHLTSRCSERLVPLVFDITDAKAVDRAFEEVEQYLQKNDMSGLWALINNAGIGIGLFVEGMTIQDYQKVFQVNYFGMIRMIQTFLPLIRHDLSNPGRIINVASLAGRVSIAGMSGYAGSKYAVEALSDSLRRELIPFGVKVVIIEPGYFKTNLVHSAGKALMSKFQSLPQHLQTLYGEQYAQWMIRNIEQAYHFAENPKIVARSIVRCCYAKYPPIRVPVGLVGQFLGIPLSMIPGEILDLEYRFFGPRPTHKISRINKAE